MAGHVFNLDVVSLSSSTGILLDYLIALLPKNRQTFTILPV